MMICIIFKELLKDFNDYILQFYLHKEKRCSIWGRDWDSFISLILATVVSESPFCLFGWTHLEGSKADGESFKSPAFVSIYIMACITVMMY